MAPLIALLLAAPGWEGKVHFQHNPPRKSGGSEGAIHFSRGRVRLEEPTPQGLMVILWDGWSLRILFPERKKYLRLSRELAAQATAPPLNLRKMRKIGREVVDGRPCTIWERKGPDITQRLWVPDEAAKKKLFFFLREVTVTPRGATEADVSDVSFADQPASLFRVPKDYRLTSR